MPNIDFFISPAYSVPPIKTIFLVKSIRIKTSVLVPSVSGSAKKSLMHKIVNSGSCFSNSSVISQILKQLIFNKKGCPDIIFSEEDEEGSGLRALEFKRRARSDVRARHLRVQEGRDRGRARSLVC